LLQLQASLRPAWPGRFVFQLPQSPATRSHPLPRRPAAGAGRRRLGQDAGDHQKIAYLIEDCGFSPSNIAAITFTNKAAKEMQERVGKLLGQASKGLTISTFHALGVRILREEAQGARLQAEASRSSTRPTATASFPNSPAASTRPPSASCSR
jgi:hypothetical protein